MIIRRLNPTDWAAFRVYGREPRALKVGDRYLDEDLMILELPRA